MRQDSGKAAVHNSDDRLEGGFLRHDSGTVAVEDGDIGGTQRAFDFCGGERIPALRTGNFDDLETGSPDRRDHGSALAQDGADILVQVAQRFAIVEGCLFYTPALAPQHDNGAMHSSLSSIPAILMR